MRQHRPEVVVTGLGVVTPFGCDLSHFWRELAAGKSAVGAIQRFDASCYPTRIAAEITGEETLSPREMPALVQSYGRIGAYAGTAARLAMVDSGLGQAGRPGDTTGIVLAAGLGTYGHGEIMGPCSAASSAGADWFDESVLRQELKKQLEPHAVERRTPGALAAGLAEWLGLCGPVMAIMTACSAGTQAIGDAARWIRNGVADVVLCGASDSEIYPMGLASFCLLGALSRRNEDPGGASRPFDAGRDGFVLGEGAAFLVLEELEHAARRNAPVYAEIAGFGSACDSYRVTDPHPSGKGAIIAMTQALRQAGVDSKDVGYINAHGTSTVLNDRIETEAIKQVFGEKAYSVPVSSTKSMIGHLTVAAGAVEAVVTILALTNQTVPPTINYQIPDPDCDLDYVPNCSRRAEAHFAMSNSFAFGGHCASLLFKRFDRDPRA